MISEITKKTLHEYLDKMLSKISTQTKDLSDITLSLTGETDYDDNCNYQKYEFNCQFEITHRGECKLQESNGKIDMINHRIYLKVN